MSAAYSSDMQTDSICVSSAAQSNCDTSTTSKQHDNERNNRGKNRSSSSKKKNVQEEPTWLASVSRTIDADTIDLDIATAAPATTIPSARKGKRSSAAKKMTTLGVPLPSQEEPDYCITIVPQPHDAPFDDSETIYAMNFAEFYTRNLLRDRVVPIVDGASVVSLRDLTWAATNYFPQMRTTTIDPFTGYEIRLDHAYNMYLDEYKKYRFDSFRRVYEDQSRIVLVVCSEDPQFVFKTTFAQLAFFRFALLFRFIEHVEARIDDIKQHWTAVTEQRKLEKRSGLSAGKSKRAPLTQKAPETMAITRGHFEIRY